MSDDISATYTTGTNVTVEINNTTTGPKNVSVTAPASVVSSGGGAGASTFLGLTDTPSTFSGYENGFIRVNSSGTALNLVNTFSIDVLSDVDITTTPPTAGQVLKWNGTNFVPAADTTSGGGATDADTLDGFDSTYFLDYNNLNNTPTLVTTLLGLTDTPSTYSSSAGRFLKVNSAGTGIEFVTTTTGATVINELNDVQISALADGHFLIYDSATSEWENHPFSGDISITNAGVVSISSGVIVNDDINVIAAIDATKIHDGSVTNTEFGYIRGLTSDAQDQINDKQDIITGAATTITGSDLTASRAVISNSLGKVAASSVTDTELGHLSGVTSNIQTQLDAKGDVLTGAVTTIVSADLTVSRAVISNNSGKIAVSSVTDTELGYVSGVTSAIQTQIDSKQDDLNSGNRLNAFFIHDGSVTNTQFGFIAGLTSDAQTQLDSKQATINASNRLNANLIHDGSISNTEFGHLDGVTSNIQTQLDAKGDVITGAASTVVSSDLTASRAVISNSLGKIAASTVTETELGYLSGVSSAIQTQLDAKQATIDASNRLNANLIHDGSVDNTEFGYLDGVTSAIQTQINSKQDVIDASNRLNANLVGDGSVDNTEFSYLDGVTSALQTQIDSKVDKGFAIAMAVAL